MTLTPRSMRWMLDYCPPYCPSGIEFCVDEYVNGDISKEEFRRCLKDLGFSKEQIELMETYAMVKRIHLIEKLMKIIKCKGKREE